jgi:histidine triad (HIT) family protein
MADEPTDEKRFVKIISGEIPVEKIYEDDQVVAFLTIRPLVDGHTLVVPKKHTSHIWDMDDDSYRHILRVAKKVAIHLRTTLDAERIGVVVKGFSVPHTHIHLIPVPPGMTVNFDPDPKPPIASDETLADIARKVRM